MSLAMIFDADEQRGDLKRNGANLLQGNGLKTAIMISLLTDGRARPGDVLPTDDADKRGWWGDSVARVAGDRFGSRLWLLHGARTSRTNLNLAGKYAEEALAWLVEDKIARKVEVEPERVRIGSTEVLGLHVRVYKPEGAAPPIEDLWINLGEEP